MSRGVIPGPLGLYRRDPAHGWQDYIGVPRYRGFGANLPTQGVINGTAFTGWEFGISDWMQFDYHILHDFVPGSAIYAHVQWLDDGTHASTVKWQLQIVAAKGHGQSAYALAAPTTVTVEQASGGQYYHMIAEVADPGYSSDELEIDSTVMIVVTRITNGATENTDAIFMVMSDLHYSSTARTTKNKAPNFYT